MPYGSHASEARLRWKAATRITDEQLPVVFPAFIHPQHGSDGKCQVCGRRIDRYRIEYQVTDPRDGYELAFHLLCYRAWQFECRRVLVHSHGTLEFSGSAEPAARHPSSRRPW